MDGGTARTAARSRTPQFLQRELREATGRVIKEAHMLDANALKFCERTFEELTLSRNGNGWTAFSIRGLNHDGKLAAIHGCSQRRCVRTHAVFDFESIRPLTIGEAENDPRAFVEPISFFRMARVWLLSDLH